MKAEAPKIYAMVLCHNCKHMLPNALSRIPFSEFDRVFFTDDGSLDGSVDYLKENGFEVILSSEMGYGANAKNGLRYAFENGADYVVEIHGDGAQFDPVAIRPAKKFIFQGYDYIIGSRLIDVRRTIKLGMPKIRLLANLVLSWIDLKVLQLPISECNSGFIIYGPRFKSLDLSKTSKGHLFSFQIISLAAFHKMKVAEVAVDCNYNQEHTSLSYPKAVVFVLQHFGVLLDFVSSVHFKKPRGIFDEK